MSRNFFLIALLGLGLILLIVNHDKGSILGVDNNFFAMTLYSGVWVAIIAAGVFYSGASIGEMAKYLAIWGLAFLVLMNVYIYRYEMQDIGSRMTAGLIPGSPISATSSDGRPKITLIRGDNKHFHAKMGLNGFEVDFLVDTGASTTTLSHEDAKSIGIDTDKLVYNIPISTANGVTRAAKEKVFNVNLGSIFRERMTVHISMPDQLSSSLLGINFLETLSSYEVRGDRMILTD
jgi:aspartyl protease family protein